ncbi:FHA domain-containing protein [Microbacterium sp. SORGH_AS_0888]|uniref:FHA domain-containing protein n=1 Tax=Microbacterium sp. SORGH_AS_0888 TaxID=3041791 RepID=UPI002781D27E|nr:FHA domain-containing protein [Microbacterium sp. SORGH_AS_0888]MDQ1129154.1 hypothetical protein [Microbacterium sp. SORGH_AS_0888]
MFSYTSPSTGEVESWGLVTDRFVLVIEGPAELVLRIWETVVREDATMEEVLELLAARGVRTLPDFALVELIDAPTGSISVALRGRGRAELGGTPGRYLSGKGAGTWVEASAQSIAEMTVGLRGEEPGPVRLPLTRGVVRTEQIHWGVPLPRLAPPVPAERPPAWAAGVDAEDELDDATVLGSARRGRRAPAAPATSELEDDLDATVLGSRMTPAAPPPATPAAPAAPPAPPAPRLRFDDGSVLDVDGVVVVGRAPFARPGTRPHALVSPRKEVSGTHAELRAEGVTIVVRDVGSTNGTTVRPVGAPDELLRDRERALQPGDRVDFGDGNTAVVVPGG